MTFIDDNFKYFPVGQYTPLHSNFALDFKNFFLTKFELSVIIDFIEIYPTLTILN